MLPASGNLTNFEPDPLRTWRLPKRHTHRAALFHNPNQDARMAVHGDEFVCLSEDDGLKHIDSLLKIQIQSERHGNTGIRRFRRDKPSVVESCVQSWG